MQGSVSLSGVHDDLQPTRPWHVVRSKRRNDPNNPARYGSTVKLAFAVLVAAVVLTLVTFPARVVDHDMKIRTEQAKADGFPQLPPGYATPEQISDFREKWGQTGASVPPFEQVAELSQEVGLYDTDSSLWGLGLVVSLGAVVFMCAIAFSRALNNLFALGFESPGLSPAWAFSSWFIPILGWFLPWWVVSSILGVLWSDRDGDVSKPKLWAQAVAGIWGITNLGLWALSPFVISWFFPTGNIDQWITRFDWSMRMMSWVPIPALVSAAVLLLVAFEQRRVYKRRERIAE